MKKRKSEYTITVAQVGEEDIPGRWRKFWAGQFAGNPRAWLATARFSNSYERHPLVMEHGHTKQEALDAARCRIAEWKTRKQMTENSKEEFYE